ncbi:coatomer gamma subunit appendage platform subdomain-containing protein [Umbelopsis sp. AD052]|nr:coatomer gamma subunit appendage platform subdomain-containing protein [Umbelopsis sp. AD052]
MKVIVIDKTGGPEVLQYKDSPKAQVEAGQILVKNPAIGVNYIDTYHRKAPIQFLLPSFLEPEVFAKRYIKDDSTYAYLTLERQLVRYINNNNASMQPFDIHNQFPHNNTTEHQASLPLQIHMVQLHLPLSQAMASTSANPLNLLKAKLSMSYIALSIHKRKTLSSGISSAKLEYNVTGMLYLDFHKLTADYPIATFTNTLSFVVKDCYLTTGEPDEEGYEDEYQVEDFDVLTGDYIQLTYICNFAEVWEQLAKTEAL